VVVSGEEEVGQREVSLVANDPRKGIVVVVVVVVVMGWKG